MNGLERETLNKVVEVNAPNLDVHVKSFLVWRSHRQVVDHLQGIGEIRK